MPVQPLPAGAPTIIGGFRVIAATAKEFRHNPNLFRGYARIVRGDGKQAVIEYNERNGQVYSTNMSPALFSGMTEWGVNYVARWYSAGHARKVFKALDRWGSLGS